MNYSQALQLKRICTEHEDLLDELRCLYGHFKNWGYDHKMISDGINKALNQIETKPKGKKTPVTMIITHHPQNPTFSNIIHKFGAITK